MVAGNSNRLLPHSYDVENPHSVKWKMVCRPNDGISVIFVKPSFDASAYDSLTEFSTKTYSSSYYSYSSLQATLDCVDSTLDTLEMVTSPWSTETWDTPSVTLSYDIYQSIYGKITTSTNPKSTTSSEVSCPERNTSSKTTATVMNTVETESLSEEISTAFGFTSSSDSGWTVISFSRSDGNENFQPQLKVKYPWSPTSLSDSTSLYPNSTETISSVFSVPTIFSGITEFLFPLQTLLKQHLNAMSSSVRQNVACQTLVDIAV